MKRVPKYSVPEMNHFCVKMDASFMHAMKIPKSFEKIFKGSISENIKLEDSSGGTWHVKMIRSNNTFSLRSGWRDFVTDNNIDQNDVLVFSCNGNFSFKVLIFDPSGCEKLAPFFAMKTNIVPEESSESSIQIISPPHVSEVKKEIISLSSGIETESSREISSHVARTFITGERACCKRKQRDLLPESTKSGKGGRRPVRQTDVQKSAKECSRKYLLPVRTYLTKDQERTANRMAGKTHKGSNLFVKILTSVNTSRYRYSSLNLPNGFACEVLKSQNQKIRLLPADLDKSKGCTGKFCNLKTARRIGGWRKFAYKNGLKEGDLCLFELRKQRKEDKLLLTMVVHFDQE